MKSVLFFLILTACTVINTEHTEPKNEQTKREQKENAATSSPAEKVTPLSQSPIANTEKVQKYCEKVDQYFAKYNWGKSQCENFQWNHVRDSFWGTPIVWYVFGDENQVKLKPKKTTVIFCGVHGDEITPIKFCFDLLNDLKSKPEVVKGNLIVIAPIVTPDSFFRKTPTRTNGRGVDVNRNLPTRDWNSKALQLWKSRYSSDKRRYPGKKSMSEQETYFQVNLINRYRPAKIISVHAPLKLIDYDGPENDQHEGAKQLLIQMSNKAGKYRINNYPFFPGSLGNWAGNERNIPTYTLELPNSDWNKTRKFYNTFRTAIYHAIDHNLEPETKKEKKLSNSDKSKNGKIL